MQVKNIQIDYLGHSGFLFSNGSGKIIAIDPYKVSDKVPKADIILITHPHFDHCSIEDIKKVAKDKTVIIIPADAQSKINKVDNVEMQIVEAGDEITVSGLKIEVMPAYNLGKEFHQKHEGWVGYIIKFKDVIVYHTGDTDKIPEMSRLTGYGKHGNDFIALLPVSGKYVMDPEEAAEVAALISPDLAIPMHYGSGVAGTIEDAKKFVELCEEKGINAKILEKI